jgi:hypothetical protein
MPEANGPRPPYYSSLPQPFRTNELGAMQKVESVAFRLPAVGFSHDANV